MLCIYGMYVYMVCTYTYGIYTHGIYVVYVYIYRLNCGEDYTKKGPNQKREKSKSKLFKIKRPSMCLEALFIFVLCPIKKFF